MVGSDFVISTHNTETETWPCRLGRVLLAVVVCRRLRQSAAGSRTLVSQVDVAASCSLQSTITEQATERLCRFGLVLRGQCITHYSSHFNKKNYFHVNGK